MNHQSIHSILTVIGTDRPGIIAGVTKILFDRQCNLEDISMTVLEGKFAMILVVCCSKKRERLLIEKDLTRLVKKTGLTFYWKDLKKKLARGESHKPGTESYLISAFGHDKTGIVYKISRLLAKYRLNITDLNSKILGYGKKSVYSMLLEVDIPNRFPFQKLERGFGQIKNDLGIEIQIKPVERLEF